MEVGRKALTEPRRIKKKKGKRVRKDCAGVQGARVLSDTLNSVKNWSN